MPYLTVAVLKPFEITSYNTSRVTQDIRNDRNAIRYKNLFAFDVGWAIGSLGYDRCFDFKRIRPGDLVSKCCRYEYVAFQSEKRCRIDFCRTVKSFDRTFSRT